MRCIRWAVAVCVVLLAVTAASAQTGGITVIVTDEAGTPLPGAIVTISNANQLVKTTSEMVKGKGIVQFPVLRAGSGYSIEVSFPGGAFATQRLDEIRVPISETVTLPVTMFEKYEESVKVTAQTDVIDLDKSESSTRFSDAFIADLPVPGRFYQSVLTMAPGVQDSDGDGNPNVHGSRNRDFETQVGGVSNVDPLTGQWLSRISPNSIEEMEVITAGAGVEFGRAQGGFARIIQKQGSNTHEGVFEFYWQTSKLDGSGAQNLTSLPDPKFDTIQPLVQFSGPLKKDKLWYRASYEQRDREQPINVLSEIAVFERNTKNFDGQLTWQASPRNKVALQFRTDPVEQKNFGVSSTRPPASALQTDRDVSTWTVNWTAPYSPKVLVESTFAWQEVETKAGPTSVGLRNDCVPDANEIFLQEALCNNLTEGTFSGGFNQDVKDLVQRLTVKGQATLYGSNFLGMSHQFKLGMNVENERYFRDQTINPRISYFVVRGDAGATDPDNPDNEEEPNLNSFGLALANLWVPPSDQVRATGTNWAIYAEDQFKPAQNLTITLGARLDREEITSEGRQPLDPVGELQTYEALVNDNITPDFCPSCDGSNWSQGFFTGYEAFSAFEEQMQDLLCRGVKADKIGQCKIDVVENINGQQPKDLEAQGSIRRASNINLVNTNFSPNVSAAWSPWTNGKTALKASMGRYYNRIPLIVPLRELEPVQVFVEYEASLLDDAACVLFQEENPDSDIPCGGTQIRGAIEPSITIQSVDRGLSTPFQDEFTFKVERALWAETSMSFQYINRQFKDQLQDFNTNLDIGDKGKCFKAVEELDAPVQPSIGCTAGFCPDGYTGLQIGMLNDPYTGVQYPDTDPGRGDGLLDDCAGERFFLFPPMGCDPQTDPFCSETQALQRPDGETDLYIQNPFWGDIYLIGNFNAADYEAYVIEFVRRQYRSWEMNASYTYSTAEGDGEDFEQVLGDDPSVRDDLRGFQSYDQRHVVKLNATTITPWGIRLGTSVTWQSGLPYSLLFEDFSVDQIPPVLFEEGVVNGASSRRRQTFVTGTRNDQRNPAWWNVDVKATKELRLGKNFNLQLSAEIFNLLDDATYSVYNPFFERGQQVNGTNEATRRFGRSWQVGMKVAF